MRITNLRTLLFFALIMALATSGFAVTTTRLWFSNDTTGQSNSGALVVHTGDHISVHFSYHRGTDPGDMMWIILRVTLNLAGTSIISTTDQNAFPASWLAAFPDQGLPSIGYVGPLHNDMLNPGNVNIPLVVPNAYGLYGLAACIPGNPLRDNIDQQFFQFIVASNAPNGQELHWLCRDDPDDTGLVTNVLDGNAQYLDIADNYLYVQPHVAPPRPR
jgi:hypothetical protein